MVIIMLQHVHMDDEYQRPAAGGASSQVPGNSWTFTLPASVHIVGILHSFVASLISMGAYSEGEPAADKTAHMKSTAICN